MPCNTQQREEHRTVAKAVGMFEILAYGPIDRWWKAVQRMVEHDVTNKDETGCGQGQ